MNTFYKGLLCLVLATALPLSTYAQSWDMLAKVLPNNRQENAGFGTSVDIDGEFAVSGAAFYMGYTQGTAHIFYRDQNGVEEWGEVSELVTPNPNQKDFFGKSVAIDGDLVIVGAPGSLSPHGSYYDNAGSGSAYIFLRNPGSIDDWNLVKELKPNGLSDQARFGEAVAIHGDWVVVGADNQDASGAAYIFHRNEGGVDNWGLVKMIKGTDRKHHDYFGSSLAIADDLLVVGAYGENHNSSSNILINGAAYVFGKNEGGTNNWGMIKKFKPAQTDEDRYYGISVAISGDELLIGSIYSAYLHSQNEGGANNWGLTHDFYDSPGANPIPWRTRRLGSAVAMSGDLVLLGESSANNVLCYVRNEGGANQWGVKETLSAEKLGFFGHSLAVSSDRIMIGANWEQNDRNGNNPLPYAGAAYIFRNGVNSSNGGTGDDNVPVSQPETDLDGISDQPSDLTDFPSKISTYPNPATGDYLFVSVPEDMAWDRVTMVNLGGDEANAAIEVSGDLVKLNIRGLTPGLYLVTFYTQNGVVSSKVMVK